MTMSVSALEWWVVGSLLKERSFRKYIRKKETLFSLMKSDRNEEQSSQGQRGS